jgi:AcrR family transcriptional regulator
MASDTRQQLLDTAEALFAERGFYGVSIAAVADELGLTKQALLHHFGSKEKLYGAVLERISNSFENQLVRTAQSERDPAGQLKAYLLALAEDALARPARTQLLMRELLDNRRRAELASTWYLQDFLETLIGRVRAIPRWTHASEAEAFCCVYQLLGAINYFAISQPTLGGIFGDERSFEFAAAFPQVLAGLIDSALDREHR